MEPDEYYESIELHIRWSDRQDLVLNVSPEETIYDIKQKVSFIMLVSTCSNVNYRFGNRQVGAKTNIFD